MPKELVAIAVQQPVLQDYEEGPVPAGNIRIKVDFGAPKRGTELTGYHGFRGASFPMGLGNMCVGRVIEIGEGVEGVSIGDRVAGYGNLRETHTWNAERALPMSDRMTWKEAVCYDPAHFALAGIRDGQVRLGRQGRGLWTWRNRSDDRTDGEDGRCVLCRCRGSYR